MESPRRLYHSMKGQEHPATMSGRQNKRIIIDTIEQEYKQVIAQTHTRIDMECRTETRNVRRQVTSSTENSLSQHNNIR